MFLMCPLTLTSPSLYLLLIGHPWWLSHVVLKTVGCILSAQGPLGGYSSSFRLVLGGQGQSLCLSPCPSTPHTSLEHLPRESKTHLHCWDGMLEQGTEVPHTKSNQDTMVHRIFIVFTCVYHSLCLNMNNGNSPVCVKDRWVMSGAMLGTLML